MSSGGNKKTTKNLPNKNSKENSSAITMEKIEEMLEQKFESYEENIKSYLAANNELLSKRINKNYKLLNDRNKPTVNNKRSFIDNPYLFLTTCFVYNYTHYKPFL